jgi:simple sugar transport system ATP-binding protein
VKSADAVLAATIGIEEDTAAPKPAHSPAGKPAGAASVVPDGRLPALALEGLTYRDADGIARLDSVSLVVKPGEIVGVAGVEGNGQTELGAILSGLTAPTAGSIVIGGKDLSRASPREITAAGAGIVPEDRHAVAMVPDLSIAENLFLGMLSRFSRFGLLDRARMSAGAAELMREFDVRAPNPELPMSSLSGGNQQKAVLARELSLANMVFLLAAQPTRGLDVGAVEAVYGRIRSARDRGLGVLLIASELDELIAVSDRIVVMYRGKVVGQMASDPANREAIGAMMSGHGHV